MLFKELPKNLHRCSLSHLKPFSSALSLFKTAFRMKRIKSILKKLNAWKMKMTKKRREKKKTTSSANGGFLLSKSKCLVISCWNDLCQSKQWKKTAQTKSQIKTHFAVVWFSNEVPCDVAQLNLVEFESKPTSDRTQRKIENKRRERNERRKKNSRATWND